MFIEIDKTLTRLTRKREDTNYHITNETGTITTEPADIERIIKEHYNNYKHKFGH